MFLKFECGWQQEDGCECNHDHDKKYQQIMYIVVRFGNKVLIFFNMSANILLSKKQLMICSAQFFRKKADNFN